MNSQDAAWYSARHSYDAPPNNANVWSNYNEYDTEAGFLSNFEADFRNAILDAVIRVAKNTVTDGGGYEDITRKVFLLSNTEVGLSNENSVAEGTLWSYFSSAARRQCYPTAEAVSNSEYTSSSLNASSYWWWWLRTPYASSANYARSVNKEIRIQLVGSNHSMNSKMLYAFRLANFISMNHLLFSKPVLCFFWLSDYRISAFL